MTDRTITLSADEVPKVRAAIESGAPVWLVQDGFDDLDQPSSSPMIPAEFVQACAPCETCDDTHQLANYALRYLYPCPDCRIELVGPCPTCRGWTRYEGDGKVCQQCDQSGAITIAHAYAIGEPLPIVQVPFLSVRQTPYDFAHGLRGPLIEVTQNGRVLLWTHPDGGFRDITDALAHYDLATLPGKWAQQFQVVQ